MRACLLAALACGLLRAQEYSFRDFVTADGLGNLSVLKLYQDHIGFLWISTENGIFRYDGDRIEAFGEAQGLPPTSGVAFAETPNGSLLVGSKIGLYRFSGNRFVRLGVPFASVSWDQGLQADGHGSVWAGTDEGLFRLAFKPGSDDFTAQRVYPAEGAAPEQAHGVFLDGSGVWFGCGKWLCLLDNGTVKTLGKDDGLPGASLPAILKDRDGDLWVRVRNGSMLERPAGETRFRTPQTPIPPETLTGAHDLDSDGRILLGSPSGLLLQTAKGWQLVDQHAGLHGGVFAAFEDRQHSLWIGTGGRGLIQWRGYRTWENYTSSSGLPSDNVYEILPMQDGTVWAGTEAGLIRGTPRTVGMEWTRVPGLQDVPVHSLQMDAQGNLWASTAARGVARLNPKTNHVDWFGEAQGLTGKWCFTIRMDRQQRLWVATDAGVFVASPPYRNFARVAELPASWFWTVAEGADGTIWAGGADGLFALTSEGAHWRHLTHADGLSNQEVVSIGPDAYGAVWVGYHYGGGIDRVHLTATGAHIETKLQRPGSDGLIYFLGFDHAGRLWAGTEKGVDVLENGHWAHYDSSDGLVWDDCDIGGFAAGPDGSIWIGTGGGLSRFRPQAETAAPVTAQVVFTALRMGRTDILGLSNPAFRQNAGALVARFAAPEAPRSRSLLFRYRIEGAGTAWTETAQRQLEFARLAPGSYRLEVEVEGAQGDWSPLEAAYSFEILNPWYRSNWVFVLYLLLPAAVVWIVFRMRTAAAWNRELELQRLVEERTRELREANETLLRLSTLDPLTGLANRRIFDQSLTREYARLKRSKTTLALILFDVDQFKSLNDTEGHQKGDEYLVAVARALAHVARRQTDVAARIGGEEFALVLPETDADGAVHIAEQVRAAVEEMRLPHPASIVGPHLTVSAGVAMSSAQNWLSPEALMAAADQALYRAKSQGRNRVESAG
ncbi:MAG TPA: diguanylate cyclase [Terracidiphilus sp.]|nr:diguanylate cyclase [Terracidiphilus sp.]